MAARIFDFTERVRSLSQLGPESIEGSREFVCWESTCVFAPDFVNIPIELCQTGFYSFLEFRGWKKDEKK